MNLLLCLKLDIKKDRLVQNEKHYICSEFYLKKIKLIYFTI
jgi:hypothetical protein